MSALFAVVGVVITLSLRDLMTSTAIGYLLLLGAGTFIFVGLSELIPGALDATAGKTSRLCKQLKKAVAFTEGSVLLGLPLIWHKRCESEHSEHNHR